MIQREIQGTTTDSLEVLRRNALEIEHQLRLSGRWPSEDKGQGQGERCDLMAPRNPNKAKIPPSVPKDPLPGSTQHDRSGSTGVAGGGKPRRFFRITPQQQTSQKGEGAQRAPHPYMPIQSKGTASSGGKGTPAPVTTLRNRDG